MPKAAILLSFPSLSLENMDWVFLGIKEGNFPSPRQPPYFFQPPPPLPQAAYLHSSGFSLDQKVGPSVILIIIILAIIVFVSGLLHLLIRILLRPENRVPDDFDNVTALQGQLQQLFHLHDSGVDQSFIETLPVFSYKAIIGLKDPFDCAVCLCEFGAEDELRLLPGCSHAFHMECIDTWLLSHSTCPLCRACLLPDSSPSTSCSTIVLVLESGSESTREIVPDRDCHLDANNPEARANSHLGFQFGDDFGSSPIELSSKSCEIQAKGDTNHQDIAPLDSAEKVVPVKLGKFRNVDGRGEGSSFSNNANTRRCFSMGSFAYVMDESSSLQVPIRTPLKKQASSKKPSLPLIPGHRQAMSVCGCESRRDFDGFGPFRSMDIQGIGSPANTNNRDANANGNASVGSKRESFSISKIWLRPKERPNSSVEKSSRRAFSFRFPMHRNVQADDGLRPKNGGTGTGTGGRTISELDVGRWVNESELGFNEENQSCNNVLSQPSQPSFARRTLLWLVAKQKKVVHSSSSPNF